jgi:hypothetical protein
MPQVKKRQTIQTEYDGLPIAHPSRDRSWDKVHSREQVASYRLPPELKLRIITMAKSLNVPSADLVRVLLEYGFTAVETGALTLTPKPDKYKL